MSDPNLVIFDCDGVLVDSETIANQVMTDGLNQLGLGYTYERTVKEFMGRSFRSCIAEIEQMAGRTIDAGFWASMQEETYRRFESELKPVTGIEAVLQNLSLPYCVASSGSHSKMQKTLGLTGLLEYFADRIFSAEDVSRGKPAPDLFLHAASSMQVKPETCLVVEDSAPGVMAAQNAGMVVLRYSSIDDAARADDIMTFNDMSQLPVLINSLCPP
jgi:HAD superfamily hydrolase (TIGR01509 family)